MTRNTKRNNWTTIVGLLLACTLAVPAQAEFITFTFGGTVTDVEDDNHFLGGAVNVGDDFSGSYTFESTTPDNWPGDRTIGSYWESVAAMNGVVAALPFQQGTDSSGKIVVADDFWSPPHDGYEIHASVDCLSISWSFAVSLDDPGAAAFNSDALPTEPPSLGFFETNQFELYSEAENVAIRGEITSLLPEPGSLLVLTFGSIGLVSRRRRGIPRESGLQ